MTIQELQGTVRDHIAHGQTGEAIRVFRTWAETQRDESLRDSLILLQNEWSTLQANIGRGIITPADESLRNNHIVNRLLACLGGFLSPKPLPPGSIFTPQQDSVWFAAAILSYQKYHAIQPIRNPELGDFYFTQAEIVKKATELQGVALASPQVNQHCVVGRNRPANPNYLMEGPNSTRRLKATQEDPVNREKPRDIQRYQAMSLDGVQINELIKWVDEVYSKKVL